MISTSFVHDSLAWAKRSHICSLRYVQPSHAITLRNTLLCKQNIFHNYIPTLTYKFITSFPDGIGAYRPLYAGDDQTSTGARRQVFERGRPLFSVCSHEPIICGYGNWSAGGCMLCL